MKFSRILIFFTLIFNLDNSDGFYSDKVFPLIELTNGFINSYPEHTIIIVNGGLKLDGIGIDQSSDINDIINLIGPPSRVKNQNLNDIKSSRQKYGVVGNNMFYWDKLGIVILQNVENSSITEINLIYDKENIYSLKSGFRGKLEIENKIIDYNINISSIDNFSDCLVKKRKLLPYERTLSCSNMRIGFYWETKNNYTELVYPNQLSSVSISMNNKESVKWEEKDVIRYRKVWLNSNMTKSLSKKYNLNHRNFSQCIADGIIAKYSKDDVHNFASELPNDILPLVESCITENFN